jgi:diaminopimelate decarboxylase
MTRDFAYRNQLLLVENVPLVDLAQRYGTPLYVYSKNSVVAHARMMDEAFDGTPHVTCYAVKANANRALLSLIAAEGLGADVGSRGELYLAREAGFPSERITFTGVGKRDDELAFALEQNIRAYNVESRDEIEVINNLALGMGKRARILLRVNLDIDAGSHAYITTSLKHNKFGVPWKEAGNILRWAQGLPGIEVRGLHSHIGSQIMRVATLRKAADALVALVKRLRKTGLTIHDIDFGGGFGVQYHGFISHPRIPEDEPRQRNLGAAVMLKKIVPLLKETGCHITIQPGRAIVAQAGVLITQVLFRKVTPTKIFLIVDGAMNDLIRPSLYHSYHQIVPLVLESTKSETVDVVGPVCESGDFFAHDRLLPVMKRGDYLALMCAGAYGYVLASNYNARLRPAEIMVEGDHSTVVRERDRLEDLL